MNTEQRLRVCQSLRRKIKRRNILREERQRERIGTRMKGNREEMEGKGEEGDDKADRQRKDRRERRDDNEMEGGRDKIRKEMKVR